MHVARDIRPTKRGVAELFFFLRRIKRLDRETFADWSRSVYQSFDFTTLIIWTVAQEKTRIMLHVKSKWETGEDLSLHSVKCSACVV